MFSKDRQVKQKDTYTKKMSLIHCGMREFRSTCMTFNLWGTYLGDVCSLEYV